MSNIRTAQAHTVKSASLRKVIEINYVNPIKPNSQNGISIFLKYICSLYSVRNLFKNQALLNDFIYKIKS